MRSRILSVLLLPAVAVLAGCATGEVLKVVPISGGKTITVPLSREGVKPGEGGGYRVSGAILLPGTEERTAFYTFGLVTLQEPALKRIQIVDISDDKESLLVDDTAPKFTDKHWIGKSDTISADDPRLQWVFQISLSARVYRFTLTRTDGSEVSFNHVVFIPPPLKTVIRSKWGEKY